MKAKQNSNRPTRGLVFGPTRGAIELSSSGKRLRVERVSAGRREGSFVNESESDMGLDTQRQYQEDAWDMVVLGSAKEVMPGDTNSASFSQEVEAEHELA